MPEAQRREALRGADCAFALGSFRAWLLCRRRVCLDDREARGRRRAAHSNAFASGSFIQTARIVPAPPQIHMTKLNGALHRRVWFIGITATDT
jgi:hypothetical protein